MTIENDEWWLKMMNDDWKWWMMIEIDVWWLKMSNDRKWWLMIENDEWILKMMNDDWKRMNDDWKWWTMIENDKKMIENDEVRPHRPEKPPSPPPSATGLGPRENIFKNELWKVIEKIYDLAHCIKKHVLYIYIFFSWWSKNHIKIKKNCIEEASKIFPRGPLGAILWWEALTSDPLLLIFHLPRFSDTEDNQDSQDNQDNQNR